MADTKQATHEVKPLSRKSDKELKREAKARLKRLDPATAAAVVDEVVSKGVTGSVDGFVTFIRERAVVGLALGFVIGSQLQAVVKSFNDNIVTPLFQFVIPNNKKLIDQTLHLRVGNHSADLVWGALAYALLNFLFVVLTIYVVLRLFKLDRLDKKD